MKPVKLLKHVLIMFSFISFTISAQVVRMETVLGIIDIELRPDVAPATVANFLNYVNDGDYDNSYIHRSVPNFVIQGGGFNYVDNTFGEVPTDSPIINESSLSNARGTISMARTASIDSATSQWFFNTVDNSSLDGNGDGYAVFGNVIKGMEVVDAIAELQRWNAGGAFSELPLINYSGTGEFSNNLVLIVKSYVLEFHINPALNGSWYNVQTDGQGMFFDYFPNLDKMFLGWFTYDTEDLEEGVSANLGNANHRWLSGLGEVNHETKTVTFDLKSTSGGLFDNGQVVTNSPAESIGTLIVAFSGCANATVEYDLITPEVQGEFDITRIVNDNVELCKRLASEISGGN